MRTCLSREFAFLRREAAVFRLLPAVERRQSANRYVWELLTQLAVIWVLVFGLLTVLLSFAVSPLNGALLDAARGATLVDAVMLILLKILPPK